MLALLVGTDLIKRFRGLNELLLCFLDLPFFVSFLFKPPTTHCIPPKNSQIGTAYDDDGDYHQSK